MAYQELSEFESCLKKLAEKMSTDNVVNFMFAYDKAKKQNIKVSSLIDIIEAVTDSKFMS